LFRIALFCRRIVSSKLSSIIHFIIAYALQGFIGLDLRAVYLAQVE
jgi:hypothetical protein